MRLRDSGNKQSTLQTHLKSICLCHWKFTQFFKSGSRASGDGRSWVWVVVSKGVDGPFLPRQKRAEAPSPSAQTHVPLSLPKVHGKGSKQGKTEDFKRTFEPRHCPTAQRPSLTAASGCCGGEHGSLCHLCRFVPSHPLVLSQHLLPCTGEIPEDRCLFEIHLLLIHWVHRALIFEGCGEKRHTVDFFCRCDLARHIHVLLLRLLS